MIRLEIQTASCGHSALNNAHPHQGSPGGSASGHCDLLKRASLGTSPHTLSRMPHTLQTGRLGTVPHTSPEFHPGNPSEWVKELVQVLGQELEQELEQVVSELVPALGTECLAQ